MVDQYRRAAGYVDRILKANAATVGSPLDGLSLRAPRGSYA
jgi:hypothetical protein